MIQEDLKSEGKHTSSREMSKGSGGNGLRERSRREETLAVAKVRTLAVCPRWGEGRGCSAIVGVFTKFGCRACAVSGLENDIDGQVSATTVEREYKSSGTSGETCAIGYTLNETAGSKCSSTRAASLWTASGLTLVCVSW